MAFITAKSQIRNTILNYIKRLVSKSVYNAISFILTPCCENGDIKTIAITGLEIGGTPIQNKKIKVVILVEDPEAASGFGVGTTDGSGDVTIS